MLYLIYTQRITVGQFFSLFIYSFFIFGPLQELGNVVNAYRETEASLDNFEEILKMPTEQKPEHPVALPSLKTLEFDRVSFQHQSASSPALSEISFRVARGETIAFVGNRWGRAERSCSTLRDRRNGRRSWFEVSCKPLRRNIATKSGASQPIFGALSVHFSLQMR